VPPTTITCVAIAAEETVSAAHGHRRRHATGGPTNAKIKKFVTRGPATL
jgi:hypothetical protein